MLDWTSSCDFSKITDLKLRYWWAKGKRYLAWVHLMAGSGTSISTVGVYLGDESMGKGDVGKKTANKMFIDEQVITVSSWSSSLLRAL